MASHLKKGLLFWLAHKSNGGQNKRKMLPSVHKRIPALAAVAAIAAAAVVAIAAAAVVGLAPAASSLARQLCPHTRQDLPLRVPLHLAPREPQR